MSLNLFKFIDRSIARKITAALLGIYLVTYVATALVVYNSVRASMRETERATLTRLASLEIDRLSATVQQISTNATAWARLDVMNDVVSGDIDKRVTHALEELARLYRLPGEIDVFDGKNRLLASSATAHKGVGMPAEWRRAGPHVSFIDKHRDPLGSDDIIAVDVAIFASFAPEQQIGTLVVTYRWNALTQLVFGAETGTILVRLGDPVRILAADPPGLLAHTDNAILNERSLASSYVVGSSPVGGEPLGLWRIMTLGDTARLGRSLRWVATELLMLGVALAAPIIVLARGLAGRLTRPVVSLTRSVSQITDMDKLNTRAEVLSQDELGALATAFNRTAANLERATSERDRFVSELEALNHSLETKVLERTRELQQAVEAKQRLIGDISHEIKSPLARLSVALGLARRSGDTRPARQFDRMEDEIDAISTLATELLTLARLDDPAARVAFAPCDLTGLVDRILADAIYEAPSRRSDVVFIALERPIIVLGNEELLRRAIENVVRNALFYTSEGDQIDVTIGQSRQGFVSITVSDQGPGVPLASLSHLFEPFYRVDDARAQETGGSGVGLSICQRVVHSHGGTVTARNREFGGLEVEMILPLTPADVTSH